MTKRLAPFLKPVPGGLPLWNGWVLLATVGGIGLWRWAPGTVASAAALPIGWLLIDRGGLTALALATAIVAIMGIAAGNYVENHGGGKDPGSVVIDEVAGQWLTLGLALVIPAVTIGSDVTVGPAGLAISFVVFRLFDITKPWPCSWADHRVRGGLGIMADDIIAGLYAGVTVALIDIAIRYVSAP